MKYQILVLTLLVFFSSQASAFLGEFDPGECVEIRTTLNATSVNISSIGIPAPNGTVLYLNEPMTKQGGTFNYTFCQTQTRGYYVYDYFDNEGETYENDFYIGRLMNSGRAMVYVVLIFSNLIFFVFFLWLGVKTPYKNLEVDGRGGKFIVKITKTKYVKLISLWIAASSLVWLFAILSGLTNNFISFEPLITLMTNLYVFLQIILGYSLSTFMVFFIMIVAWKDILWSKQIKSFGRAFVKNVS